MTSTLDENTQFVDTSGAPLVAGKVYFGEQNADPVLNPKSIFSNRALTTEISNPQTLDSLGRSTSKVWIDGSYSLRVETSEGALVYTELDNGEPSNVGILSLNNISGANVITATASTTITSYLNLQQFTFLTVQTNTSDVTLNIDSLGAITIKKNLDQDIEAGDFETNQIVVVSYNQTNSVFEWTNQNIKSLEAAVASNTDNVFTGPSSAVDEHIAVFDGTTGKIIKDSGESISDVISSAGLTTNSTVYLTSSTYTKSTGLKFITGFAVGGGGGGNSGSGGSTAGKGGDSTFGSIISGYGGEGAAGANGAVGKFKSNIETAFVGATDRYFSSSSTVGLGGVGSTSSGGNGDGCFFYINASDIGTTEIITIGAGGAGIISGPAGTSGKIVITEHI